MTSAVLTFRDTTFTPVIRNNQPWLTATEIGKALGYSDDKAISRIYRRNASEFTSSMTAIVEGVKLTPSVESNTYSNLEKKIRIFSLRGAHLIGMFARTKLAAEFRRWVLDILDQYTTQLPQSAEETLLTSEQQTLSEIVHKRAEGYGELQGKVLAEIWSRVHRKFRVAKYSQLPRTQLSEAILYVAGMEIKTGEYQGHQSAEEISHQFDENFISTKQRQELEQAVTYALLPVEHDCGDSGRQWAYNRLRVRFNLRCMEEMRTEQFPLALAELKQIRQDLKPYLEFRTLMHTLLCRGIIGAGLPWTNDTARKWKLMMDRKVLPIRPDWLLMKKQLLY